MPPSAVNLYEKPFPSSPLTADAHETLVNLIYSFVCISAAVAFAQDQSITYCDPQGDQKGPIPVYSDSRRAWVIENLACGQPVTFLAIEQEWAKIKIGDRIGYVDSRFIRHLQSSPELEKRVADLEKQIRGQQQPQTAEPTFHPAPASQPAEKSEGTQVTTTPDSEVRGSASVNWTRLPPSEAELQRRRRNEIEMATERAATKRVAKEREERIAEQRWAQKEADIHRLDPPPPSALAMHLQAELEDLTRKVKGESARGSSS